MGIATPFNVLYGARIASEVVPLTRLGEWIKYVLGYAAGLLLVEGLSAYVILQVIGDPLPYKTIFSAQMASVMWLVSLLKGALSGMKG